MLGVIALAAQQGRVARTERPEVLHRQCMIEIVVLRTAHLVSQRFIAIEAASAKTLEYGVTIYLLHFTGDQAIEPTMLCRLAMLVACTFGVKIRVDSRVLADATLKLMT